MLRLLKLREKERKEEGKQVANGATVLLAATIAIGDTLSCCCRHWRGSQSGLEWTSNMTREVIANNLFLCWS